MGDPEVTGKRFAVPRGVGAEKAMENVKAILTPIAEDIGALVGIKVDDGAIMLVENGLDAEEFLAFETALLSHGYQYAGKRHVSFQSATHAANAVVIAEEHCDVIDVAGPKVTLSGTLQAISTALLQIQYAGIVAVEAL